MQQLFKLLPIYATNFQTFTNLYNHFSPFYQYIQQSFNLFTHSCNNVSPFYQFMQQCVTFLPIYAMIIQLSTNLCNNISPLPTYATLFQLFTNLYNNISPFYQFMQQRWTKYKYYVAYFGPIMNRDSKFHPKDHIVCIKSNMIST